MNVKPITKKNRWIGIRALSLALVLLLIGLVPTGAYAQDKVRGNASQKEETVYVVTHPDGSIKETVVSDQLTNGEDYATIVDRSDLSDIENVKGDEGFQKDGEELSWQAKGANIYYQGNSTKDIPITMEITYRLNGNPVQAEDLAGKSGRVSIHIDYSNREKRGEVYVPFLVISGMMVDNDVFEHLEINQGKLVSDGENTMVVGFVIPGFKDSLGLSDDKLDLDEYVEITADVKEFKLDTIMTVATSNVFEDLNLDEIESLSDLDESVAKLDSAGAELVKGAAQLASGVEKAEDGGHKLVGGAGQLGDALEKIDQSVGQLAKNGTKPLAGGAKNLSNGARELDQGIGTLGGALSQLADGAGDLNDATGQVAGGTEQLASGLGQTASGIQTAKGSLQQLNQKAAELFSREGNSIPESYRTKIQELLAGYQGIEAGLEDASQGLSQLQSGADGLKQGTAGLQSGTEELKKGLEKLNGEEGTKALKSGSSQLSDGADQLSKGSSKLHQGVRQLKEGTSKTSSGAGSLHTGIKSLVAGLGELERGSEMLADGMKQYYAEGIHKIVDLYQGDVKQAVTKISDIHKAAGDYEIFTDKAEGTESSVKFLYRTDSIE